MGTVVQVSLAGTDAGRADELSARCQGMLEGLEDRLSFFRPGSDVSRLNAAETGSYVPVGPDLQALVALSLRFGELSGGAFDVTVGPLMRLWGFGGGHGLTNVPSDEAIVQAVTRVGYTAIATNAAGVALLKPGMKIDLGGIAKGYAVDRCCDALRQGGARDFLVNLGGNLRAYGSPAPGRAWRIGVRNPFNTDALLGTLELPEGWATATSGNYERFVTVDGRRYSHIMDPRTGRPVEGMAGVTVLAPTAVETDGLSTTLFVLGVEAGTRALGEFPGAEALFVPDRQPVEIWATGGMARRFVPNPEFRAAVRVIR
jgi:thiamine biosynthesis lipoprotein